MQLPGKLRPLTQSAFAFVALSTCFAASAKAPHLFDESTFDTTASETVVSPSRAAQILNAADQQFTREQVCEDYEVGLFLLSLIQSPIGRRGLNTTDAELSNSLKNCPGTLSGVAKELRRRQVALADFHTHFDPTSALDFTTYPVISECSDEAVCQDIVGATLRPVLSEATRGSQGQTLYATAGSSSGADRVFEVESIDGKNNRQIFNEVVQSRLISNPGTGGNHVNTLVPVLRRHILDDLDKNDRKAVVRDIQSGERFNITFSYQASETIPFKTPSLISGFRTTKSFGCVDTEPGSTSEVGACVTDKGRAVVWVSTFSIWNAIGMPVHPEPARVAQKLLARRPDAARLPVIVDVRGNGGGSPYLASDFACTFGDNASLRMLAKRRLNPSYWPETFTLSSGRTLRMEELAKSGNNDLARKLPGWHVSSTAPSAARYDYNLGFFERIDESDAECAAMRDKRFANTKWVVMTNGREYSATENYLSFLTASHFKFKILGNTTMGGTGAPMFVTLPNTKMRLRLSQARHIDGTSGTFPIEKVGVPASQFSLRQSPGEFERWLIDSLTQGTVATENSSYAPYIFRQAQAIRM